MVVDDGSNNDTSKNGKSSSSSTICYVDGRYLPIEDAVLSVHDIGILRGFSVFDYTRTYKGAPFHLTDHVERLMYSASQIDLHVPHSVDGIVNIVMNTLKMNRSNRKKVGNDDDYHNSVTEEHEDCGVRLLVTGGLSNTHFLPSTSAISNNDEDEEDCYNDNEYIGTSADIGDDGQEQYPSRCRQGSVLAVLIEPLPVIPVSKYKTGIRVITVTDLVREFSTVKSTNYIGAIMAVKRARSMNADDALYVDKDTGNVSELTRSNVFFVKDGIIVTPDDDILYGITRKVLRRLIVSSSTFKALDVRPIKIDEALRSDEAFCTSSTQEVMPIVRINENVIGKGRPGPITRACHELFKAYASGAGATSPKMGGSCDEEE